jgi:hypothetical protein
MNSPSNDCDQALASVLADPSFHVLLSACANGTCAIGECSTGWGDCNGAFIDGCEVQFSPENCWHCPPSNANAAGCPPQLPICDMTRKACVAGSVAPNAGPPEAGTDSSNAADGAADDAPDAQPPSEAGE